MPNCFVSKYIPTYKKKIKDGESGSFFFFFFSIFTYRFISSISIRLPTDSFNNKPWEVGESGAVGVGCSCLSQQTRRRFAVLCAKPSPGFPTHHRRQPLLYMAGVVTVLVHRHLYPLLLLLLGESGRCSVESTTMANLTGSRAASTMSSA